VLRDIDVLVDITESIGCIGQAFYACFLYCSRVVMDRIAPSNLRGIIALDLDVVVMGDVVEVRISSLLMPDLLLFCVFFCFGRVAKQFVHVNYCTIMQLWNELDSFAPTTLYGLAAELQPTYRDNGFGAKITPRTPGFNGGLQL
jgi:hypothetical protein